MSRYIDADNAIERLGVYLMTDAQIEYGGLASEDIDDWKPIAIDIFKGAPTIDIVRCKECKKRDTFDCGVAYYDESWDEWHYDVPSEEWFCADGEREDE